MTIIKKIISVLCVLLLVFSFTACNGGVGGKNDGKIKIVCAVFPLYDWVKQIAGDSADVELLVDNGADIHSYQPSAADIISVSTCDLFIYIGGTSDVWVSNILKNSANGNCRIINIMELLSDRVLPADTHGDDGHGDDHDESCDHSHDSAYDEHVWLSLKNAMSVCEEISRVLGEIDSENAESYSKNAREYCGKLASLDAEYESVVLHGAKDTVLFGDRFPFKYLFNDYSLKYYAAFPGCSSETDASFETVISLAQTMDRLSLTAVLVTESSDGEVAGAIAESTNNASDKRILTMDSLQSVTQKQINGGKNYIDTMRANLEVLREALK